MSGYWITAHLPEEPRAFAVQICNPSNGTGTLRYGFNREEVEEWCVEANVKAFCLGLSAAYEVTEVENSRNLRMRMGWPT